MQKTDDRTMTKDPQDQLVNPLIQLFNDTFSEKFNVKLVRGQHEPIYLPADKQYSLNRILFAHGYFSSALHEIAHWLIAGEKRREQIDYGYWYHADGRNPEQQRDFEQVEVKPQAIEWILSQSARHRFSISVDNLNAEISDPNPFKKAVYRQVMYYIENGLSQRTEKFRQALVKHFSTKAKMNAKDYHVEMI